MILVIGATGTTGGAVLRRLHGLGVPVRALVRPGTDGPTRAGRTPPGPWPGVPVVTGDAGDPRSLRAATDGAAQVLLAMGNGPRQLEYELAVVDAAVAAGVEHLVKVSAPVVGPDVPVAVARLHHRVEQAVVAAGLGHTFLRPYAFQQNLLRAADAVAATGCLVGVTPDTPVNRVDVRDVADVAAVALTTTRTRGRALVLTGPEAVSDESVARRLTALGRPTRCVAVGADAHRRDLRRAGLPPWLVEHLVEIRLLAATRPETPNDTVERITGHPARRLDDFLAEHLDRFTAASAAAPLVS